MLKIAFVFAMCFLAVRAMSLDRQKQVKDASDALQAELIAKLRDIYGPNVIGQLEKDVGRCMSSANENIDSAKLLNDPAVKDAFAKLRKRLDVLAESSERDVASWHVAFADAISDDEDDNETDDETLTDSSDSEDDKTIGKRSLVITNQLAQCLSEPSGVLERIRGEFAQLTKKCQEAKSRLVAMIERDERAIANINEAMHHITMMMQHYDSVSINEINKAISEINQLVEKHIKTVAAAATTPKARTVRILERTNVSIKMRQTLVDGLIVELDKPINFRMSEQSVGKFVRERMNKEYALAANAKWQYLVNRSAINYCDIWHRLNNLFKRANKKLCFQIDNLSVAVYAR